MNSKIYFGNNIKAFKDEADGRLYITGYANTVTKDRAKEIVVAQAWNKGMDNYKKNPVLLFQHDQNKPIGTVTRLEIDSNGLKIEAAVSTAAEKLYGTQTLIKDGALKAFSVCFVPKDGKIDKKTDTTYITDLELLEISIVSIPANQDSLFNIMKSLSAEDKAEFLSKLEVVEDFNEKAVESIINEIITSGPLTPNETIAELGLTEIATIDKILPIDLAIIEKGRTVQYNGEKYIFDTTSTSIKLNSLDNTQNKFLEVDPSSVFMINIWDTNKKSFDLELGNVVEKALTKEEFDNYFDDLVVLYDAKSKTGNAIMLSYLNDIIFLKSQTELKDQLSVNRIISFTDKLKETIEESEEKSFMLSLLVKSKEIINMPEATQETVVETVVEKTVADPVAVVKEANVEQLLKATETAIMKHVDATTRLTTDANEVSALKKQVDEMKANYDKYKEQIAALTSSKMQYMENSNVSPVDKGDVSKAVMLAFAQNPQMQMKDLMSKLGETKIGTKVSKAVTSIDAFLTDFSSDLQGQMEMELVVAKMLTRISVPARNFQIPVADEASGGDVAQFASGTFATGVSDTTRVPTTAQSTIASVNLTPHKWMDTTHLARDEEEDTVLPLIGFLQQAAMRRLARAVDKSILRGDGSLSGFTAAPTNDITAATGYASVLTGICTLANNISGLRVASGGNSTKATPANIASARALLGRYGLQLGSDLVYLTTVEGYNELVQNSDFRTVDKFGPNATYLTGAVGAIYGIPIMITEFLDVVGANNHIGLLMYKPGFIIGERRAVEIESEYDPRRQLTAIYMSTRFDMKALTTNASSVLDATKYPFAAVVRSNA